MAGFLKRTSAQDPADPTEEALRASHKAVTSAMTGLNEQESTQWMQKRSTENKDSARDVQNALLFTILTDANKSNAAFRDLQSVVSDGFEAVMATATKLVEEKWPRMTSVARSQIVWILDESIKLKARRSDWLCAILLRQIAGGTGAIVASAPGSGSAAAATPPNTSGNESRSLAKELLNILSREKSWLYGQRLLMQLSIYHYVRIVSEHGVNAISADLRNDEIAFITALMTERPAKEWIPIGRDLIRVLNDMPRSSELFPEVWKILRMPAGSDSAAGDGQLTVREQILSLPTPQPFLRARLTPEMESQLMFIMQKVTMGNQRKYQTTFVQRFLPTVESGSLVADIVRFICGCWHPSNSVLASNVVPRWAMLGWLIKTVRAPAFIASAKLAVVYDYMYYEPSTNLMNIEPAALLMFHSIPKYVDITQSVIEFLTGAVEGLQPPFRQRAVTSVETALRTVVQRGVIPGLDQIIGSPLLHPKAFEKFAALFTKLHVKRSVASPAQTPQQPNSAPPNSQTQPSSPSLAAMYGSSGGGGDSTPTSPLIPASPGDRSVTSSQLKRPVQRNRKDEKSPTAAASPTTSDDDTKRGAKRKPDWGGAAAASSNSPAEMSVDDLLGQSSPSASPTQTKRLRPTTNTNSNTSVMVSASYSPPSLPATGSNGPAVPLFSLAAGGGGSSPSKSSDSSRMSDSDTGSAGRGSSGGARKLKKPRSRQKAESELNALIAQCQTLLERLQTAMNEHHSSQPAASASGGDANASATDTGVAGLALNQFLDAAANLLVNRPSLDTISQIAGQLSKTLEPEFAAGVFEPSALLTSLFRWVDAPDSNTTVNTKKQYSGRLDLLRSMAVTESATGLYVLDYSLSPATATRNSALPLYTRYCRTVVAPTSATGSGGSGGDAPASSEAVPITATTGSGGASSVTRKDEQRMLQTDLELCRDRCFDHFAVLIERLYSSSNTTFRSILCAENTALLRLVVETLSPPQALSVMQSLAVGDAQIFLSPRSNAIPLTVASLQWSAYEQTLCWQFLVAEFGSSRHARTVELPQFLSSFVPEVVSALRTAKRPGAGGSAPGNAAFVHEQANVLAGLTSLFALLPTGADPGPEVGQPLLALLSIPAGSLDRFITTVLYRWTASDSAAFFEPLIAEKLTQLHSYCLRRPAEAKMAEPVVAHALTLLARVRTAVTQHITSVAAAAAATAAPTTPKTSPPPSATNKQLKSNTSPVPAPSSLSARSPASKHSMNGGSESEVGAFVACLGRDSALRGVIRWMISQQSVKDGLDATIRNRSLPVLKWIDSLPIDAGAGSNPSNRPSPAHSPAASPVKRADKPSAAAPVPKLKLSASRQTSGGGDDDASSGSDGDADTDATASDRKYSKSSNAKSKSKPASSNRTRKSRIADDDDSMTASGDQSATSDDAAIAEAMAEADSGSPTAGDRRSRPTKNGARRTTTSTTTTTTSAGSGSDSDSDSEEGENGGRRKSGGSSKSKRTTRSAARRKPNQKRTDSADNDNGSGSSNGEEDDSALPASTAGSGPAQSPSKSTASSGSDDTSAAMSDSPPSATLRSPPSNQRPTAPPGALRALAAAKEKEKEKAAAAATAAANKSSLTAASAPQTTPAADPTVNEEAWADLTK